MTLFELQAWLGHRTPSGHHGRSRSPGEPATAAAGSPVLGVNEVEAEPWPGLPSWESELQRGEGAGCSNADFHAAISTPVSGSGELEVEAAVAPPGDGGVGGEVGVAEHG